MMYRFAAAALLIVSINFAHATDIRYMAESLSGADWRYSYLISNDTLAVGIEEFTIYFDTSHYSNLAVNSSPAGWNSLVAQPDSNIPANGFFDSLTFAQGIAPTSILGGFSATFTYLGSGTPGAQPFEIVDSAFNVIDSRLTQAIPVPEPSQSWLFAAGLGLLAVTTRPKRSHKLDSSL